LIRAAASTQPFARFNHVSTPVANCHLLLGYLLGHRVNRLHYLCIAAEPGFPNAGLSLFAIKRVGWVGGLHRDNRHWFGNAASTPLG